MRSGHSQVTGATQVFSGTFGGGNVTLGGGSLAINENTTFDAGAQLVRNSGNLTIASGKTLTAQGGSDIVLGSSYSIANGNIVATGAGSTFQVIASSLVNSGGSLSILNGASGLIGSYIDVGIGSTGNLTVSGTGSSFSMAVSSFWGDGGTANVTFSTNAAETLAQLDIARSNGSIANIQVLSGADVTSGTITMGNHSNIATGDILVSGAGSTWTQNGSLEIHGVPDFLS